VFFLFFTVYIDHPQFNRLSQRTRTRLAMQLDELLQEASRATN